VFENKLPRGIFENKLSRGMFENKLPRGIFENKLPRGIFGTQMKNVTEGWRKLHNEQLHNLYSTSNIIRVIKSRMKMGGACSTRGEMKTT
jgi:hypothetical protein